MSGDLRRIPEVDNQLDSELSNTRRKALVIYMLKSVYKLYKKEYLYSREAQNLDGSKTSRGFAKQDTIFLNVS